jgi:hypothetical protein
MKTEIDVNFKSYDDTPKGKDPDTYSESLHQCHALLWSKPLPNGITFQLKTSDRAPYIL